MASKMSLHPLMRVVTSGWAYEAGKYFCVQSAWERCMNNGVKVILNYTEGLQYDGLVND